MVVKASRKSTFGNVRQLPSGRYQVRYTGSDGLQHTAPRTYATKADANAYLATVHSDLVRETWKEVGIKLFSKPSQRDLLRNRVFSGEAMMTVWGGMENGLPNADSGATCSTHAP